MLFLGGGEAAHIAKIDIEISKRWNRWLNGVEEITTSTNMDADEDEDEGLVDVTTVVAANTLLPLPSLAAI